MSLALGLLPFAGIAFLRFIGVVRDRLGPLEDQFFATVFFGSGLLFLAMAFVSAALAGGILATYASEQRRFIDSGMYTLTRAVLIASPTSMPSDGRCVDDLVGDDLGPDAAHATLAGVADLRAGTGTVAEHYLKPVGHVDFSGMGRRSQRIHPRNESAQPIVNAVTHAHICTFHRF